MSSRQELIKRIEATEKEMKLLKSELKNQKNDTELRLESTTGYLLIKYDGESLGHILPEGKCVILSTETMLDTYTKWRDNGMKCSDGIVDWKGGQYQIVNYMLKRIDAFCGNIYDFKDCESVLACSDENIERFPHNKRAIIF